MAKPPDCSHCQKPATIHLTQIINNQIKKLDFCENCPHQKGVTDPTGFSLAQLLAQNDLSASTGADGSLTCSACGFSPSDFKRLGRLGCPECYESLGDFISPMLEKMHRGTHHTGKCPDELLARIQITRRIEAIEKALREAIEEEAYEEAARLRDELKALQNTQVSGNVNYG
ncbi:UvrB/UvrC motif-containing protein [Cerasicoccus arenae]|uniref:UVR domain-containing protein n=1 Tax=Cerasicoccus arenae TaxID=424488 RepID=A0A8J3DDF5_9BACT|nr:UvrB/UvrC motif-containing protein [Cerasicoccus arenae]MBK1857915.1 UvrB/UvrC motif-containing protein [Cerasicoccus arenae]GHC09609.1 hypothetical protein GCM10007047_28650 [Cerasicoccus arenae]